VRWRRLCVIAQTALATGLTAAAVLLLRSTLALETAPRGYDADVMTAVVSIPADGAGSVPGLAFESLLTSARGVPGATRAAVATRVPLAGAGGGSNVALMGETFEGRPDLQVRIRPVSAAYFDTIGVPILQGREFDGGDTRTSPRVAVVNETLASRLGRTPLVGESIKFELSEFNAAAGRITPWEIVGVVADTFDRGPRLPVEPEVFVALPQTPPDVFQWTGHQAVLAMRTPRLPGQAVADLRAALKATGLRIPLDDVRTLGDRMSAHIAGERGLSRVLLLLAISGVSLSGFGLFAVVTFTVRSRRREFAVRMAMGAAPATLARAVLRDGLATMALGFLVGLAVFSTAADGLRPLLFGVGFTDVKTFASVAAVLAGVTMVGLYAPARAVTVLNPVSVLREDG
jgi:hypothetical protein